MGESWRATIDRTPDKKHWLVYLDNCIVPNAFNTFGEVVDYIANQFGLTIGEAKLGGEPREPS